VDRRGFLKSAFAGGGASLLGPAAWTRVLAADPKPGAGPYGPLQAADGNGLMLPAGFRSRIISRAPLPIGGTSYLAMPFPDGSACFPTGDGGWILVTNSETPPDASIPLTGVLPDVGGVSAIRFAADGTIVDAYAILEGSRTNCAGGQTPWGTWLSAEEFDDGPGPPGNAGRVWECDPSGATPARALPGLGAFKHEAAAVDPDRQQVYLSEDQDDGLFYRATPAAWPDLSTGTLEAAERRADGSVVWHRIADPTAAARETRLQAPGATAFNGGEGCVYERGHVYLTTKGDDRVWDLDIAAQRMTVLYDATKYDNPILTGVDNIIVSPQSGDLLVAEDGGNMEIVLITPEGEVAPLARATGLIHGVEVGSPIPTASEVTGLALSPDGTRLYFNSQRGAVFGITYEISGPFRTRALSPAAPPTPTTALPQVPGDPDPGQLPATGLASGSLLAAGALAASGAVLARRITSAAARSSQANDDPAPVAGRAPTSSDVGSP
jgi:hypothetical protein